MIVTNTVINYKLTSHVIKKRTNNKISFIEFVLIDLCNYVVRLCDRVDLVRVDSGDNDLYTAVT